MGGREGTKRSRGPRITLVSNVHTGNFEIFHDDVTPVFNVEQAKWLHAELGKLRDEWFPARALDAAIGSTPRSLTVMRTTEELGGYEAELRRDGFIGESDGDYIVSDPVRDKPTVRERPPPPVDDEPTAPGGEQRSRFCHRCGEPWGFCNPLACRG